MKCTKKEEKSPWTAKKSKPGRKKKKTKAEFLKGKKKTLADSKKGLCVLVSITLTCPSYFSWFSLFLTRGQDCSINTHWSSTRRTWLLHHYCLQIPEKITRCERQRYHHFIGCRQHILLIYIWVKAWQLFTTLQMAKTRNSFLQEYHLFKWINGVCRIGRFSWNLTRTHQGTKQTWGFFILWIFLLWQPQTQHSR